MQEQQEQGVFLYVIKPVEIQFQHIFIEFDTLALIDGVICSGFLKKKTKKNLT